MAVLKASGAGKIIAVDIAPFRLEYAKKVGADVVVNPKEQDVEAIVAAETGLGRPRGRRRGRQPGQPGYAPGGEEGAASASSASTPTPGRRWSSG